MLDFRPEIQNNKSGQFIFRLKKIAKRTEVIRTRISLLHSRLDLHRILIITTGLLPPADSFHQGLHERCQRQAFSGGDNRSGGLARAAHWMAAELSSASRARPGQRPRPVSPPAGRSPGLPGRSHPGCWVGTAPVQVEQARFRCMGLAGQFLDRQPSIPPPQLDHLADGGQFRKAFVPLLERRSARPARRPRCPVRPHHRPLDRTNRLPGS